MNELENLLVDLNGWGNKIRNTTEVARLVAQYLTAC